MNNFPLKRRGTVFCPSLTLPAPPQAGLQAHWRTQGPLLTSTGQAGIFGFGPLLDTLHCPQFPQIHLRALAGAERAFSFHWDSALAAASFNTPTVFFSSKKSAIKRANAFHVPAVHIPEAGFSPLTLAKEAQTSLLSWDAERVMKQILRHAKRQDRDRKSAFFLHTSATNVPLNLAMISDSRFFPSLLGVLHNLASLDSSPIQLHLLTLGKPLAISASTLPPQVSIRHYGLGDLWGSRELPAILNRSIAHQAYSSKARLALRALRSTGAPVLYSDADLYFFRDPRRLLDRLKTRPILLFPHWNDDLAYQRLHGIFNAGLFGVAPGAEPFLEWWADLCWLRCSNESGFFDDQGYLDLAPLFFDKAGIYRDGDENVAPWNLESLGVSVEGGRAWRTVRTRLPVGSYHAASPDRLGLFEVKAGWDQVIGFQSGLEKLGENTHFFETLVRSQSSYRPDLKRIETLLHSLNRRLPTKPVRLTASMLERFLSSGVSGVLALVEELRVRVQRSAPANSPNSDRLKRSWVAVQRRLLEH